MDCVTNIVWRLRMSSFLKRILSASVIILSIFSFSLVAVPFVCGQDGFWVSVDLSKCHYTIDARIDLNKGFIEGKQRVTLMNDSDSRSMSWLLTGIQAKPVRWISGRQKGSSN